MQLINVSPDIPLAHYSLILYLGASFSIVVFLTTLIKLKSSLRNSVLFTVIFFSAFYWWAYTKADKYYSANISEGYIEFHYISPSFSKSVKLSDVKSISFGTANRSGGTCYLSFYTYSGDRYKSTAIPERIKYCKDKRTEVLAILDKSKD